MNTPTTQHLYVVETLGENGWQPLHGYRPAPLHQCQSLHSYYTGEWVNRFYRVRKFN